MIGNWLAKLSSRLHRIDAIEAQVQALAASQAASFHASQVATEDAVSSLREELAALRATIDERAEAAEQRAATSLQAQFDTRGFVRGQVSVLEETLGHHRQALGRIETRQTALLPSDDWDAQGFPVTSQFGEDGFLQHLIRHVPLPQKTFIEFGVEDYREANTRFLLEKDRWRGLVLEGDPDAVAKIEADRISWWRDLTVAQAFVSTDNVDALFAQNGFSGELGLLSIDIDGNDYWIWEAISSVNPRLVSVEYNFRFGPEVAAAVPYDPTFVKSEAHPSRIYYGASLRALAGLADTKGYDLVGCSDGGVNAFFVRRDCRPDAIPRQTVAQAYRAGQHAEVYCPEESARPDGVVRRSAAWQTELLLSLPLVRFEGEGWGAL